MSPSVLLTAAIEDTEPFQNRLTEENISVFHYPLERYKAITADKTIQKTLRQLNRFENIVHGSKRNAQYFVEEIKQLDLFEEAQQQLNLALDQYTADYLEREGIPAIHPQAQGKAINLLEFMLRVRRIGETLYPCGDKTAEELPGFLQELDIPVQELALFTLEGPTEEALKQYREALSIRQPGIIIFHSRRSVNRILAAFPNLNLESVQVVAGDQGVSDKLARQGIDVDRQAQGSWDSILDQLKQ